MPTQTISVPNDLTGVHAGPLVNVARARSGRRAREGVPRVSVDAPKKLVERTIDRDLDPPRCGDGSYALAESVGGAAVSRNVLFELHQSRTRGHAHVITSTSER
jgi:hypothetical protein